MALAFAIMDIDDEHLRALQLLEVRPEPDASRLAVVWGAAPGANLEAAEEALQRHRGALRHAVAQALTRKQAPTLSCYLLPPFAREVKE